MHNNQRQSEPDKHLVTRETEISGRVGECSQLDQQNCPLRRWALIRPWGSIRDSGWSNQPSCYFFVGLFKGMERKPAECEASQHLKELVMGQSEFNIKCEWIWATWEVDRCRGWRCLTHRHTQSLLLQVPAAGSFLWTLGVLAQGSRRVLRNWCIWEQAAIKHSRWCDWERGLENIEQRNGVPGNGLSEMPRMRRRKMSTHRHRSR